MEGQWVSVKLGGVDESKQSVVTGSPEAALNIENLERDPEGYWRKIGGTQQVGTWLTTDGKVFGIQWFNPRPNQRWLVYERTRTDETSELGYVALPSGTLTAIATRRFLAGVGPRPSYIERGRWLYHVNSFETPLRWDGWRTSPMGFVDTAAAPNASGGVEAGGTAGRMVDAIGIHFLPTGTVPDSGLQRGLGEISTSTGTGAAEYWKYGYCVTWVNDLGMESPPSSMVFANGKNTTLDDIGTSGLGRSAARLSVLGAPNHVRGMRIYRTFNLIDVEGTNGQEAVYLHSEFPVAYPFEFVDMKPDDELGTMLDREQLGPVPNGIGAMAFWQGATWVAVDDMLQHSHPILYEQFPPGNRISVGTRASGKITALIAVADGLLVFKRRGTFMVKGNAVSGYHVETLSEEIGTPAPRTVVQVHGTGVFFLSEHGPYVVVGRLEADQPSRLVSLVDGVKKTWRNVVGRSVLSTSWAVHNAATREVWFQVPEGGDPTPSYGIVYHYDIGQWSFRPGWRFSCGTVYNDFIWLGSHDVGTNGDAGTHVVTPGSLTRLSQDFDGVYETGHIRPKASRTTIPRIHIRALAGVGSIEQVEHRADRNTTYREQIRSDIIQEHQEEDVDKWGTGLFGTGIWVDDEYQVLPVDLTYATGIEHSFRITGDLRLSGLDLCITEGQGNPPVYKRRP